MEATDVNIDARVGPLLNGDTPAGAWTEPVAALLSEPPTPVDVQAVRMLLAGTSIVDWRRLMYTHRDEVVSFLAVNGYNVNSKPEMVRLGLLHQRAMAYLRETYDLRIPARIARCTDPCDLFVAASAVPGTTGDEQRSACVVLKIMHVINHLEGRRLIHHLSVSERALFLAAAQKVDDMIHRMRSDGLGIVSYDPSTKDDHSLLTKLISKPRVTAAQIFDKLRFRLVTRSAGDLVPVIMWLLRNLFPYNHVIAGESHNTILDEAMLRACLERHGVAPVSDWREASGETAAAFNPATSPSFRMVNFVVELPVRIERLVSVEDQARFAELGHLVHVTLEFQLFDRETALANEAGPGNHGAYKRRQLLSVGQRLWGPDGPPLVSKQPDES